MNNSSLILLVKSMDKSQLKELNSFVRSPYFNTNKALTSLFEYIRKQHPEYAAEKLEKKYVYKKLFGKTEYNDGFLRVLMSNLQHLAEEYLTVSAFQKDTILKKKFLLDKIAGNPPLKKLSEKVLNEGLKEAGALKAENPDDFLGKYFMSFYRKFLYSTGFTATKSNKPTDELFDEQKYLTYFFLMRMLADHFYHLNQSQIMNYTPKFIFLDEIIIFLENNPEYLELPTLNMAYLRVLLLKNNRKEDLYRLKSALYGSSENLGQKDCFNTISIIINFCHKNFYLSGDKTFLYEKLEILQFGLNKGINSFIENDYFDPNRYNNMVSTLFELNRIDEAEKFIYEYHKKLDPDDRNFWENFSFAELKTRQGKHDEALSFLARIRNVSAVSYKFSLKALQLRIYYDAGLWEQAASAADSFRHFLQKESLMNPVFNEQYRNFYSFYTKLLALKSGKNSKALRDIKVNLQSIHNIVHKNWLLERISSDK
ncbi:MAG: hypothetical protein UZ05_CHB002001043 [Chlorobi bacterium OLB5]|nr:MAG: hypothetical protein UZ05_CHB002001043 [Chlorobi bacterium OLB5]